MSRDIGPIIRLFASKDGRSLTPWRLWCFLVLGLVVRFTALDPAICKAGGAVTAAGVKRNLDALRTDSSKVQGEIRVFRTETVNPAALEKLPTEIGMPLLRSGLVWRDGEKARFDFKTYTRERIREGDSTLGRSRRGEGL